MKKLISVALTLLLVLQLGAQPKEVQNLLKTYEKTKAQRSLPTVMINRQRGFVMLRL